MIVRICNPAIKNDSGAILEPTEWERIADKINAAVCYESEKGLPTRQSRKRASPSTEM
jgi:hypothetical protein